MEFVFFCKLFHLANRCAGCNTITSGPEKTATLESFFLLKENGLAWKPYSGRTTDRGRLPPRSLCVHTHRWI